MPNNRSMGTHDKLGYNPYLLVGSMYAMYGNIYHQYTPNDSIYTSTMDPMGNEYLDKRALFRIPVAS